MIKDFSAETAIINAPFLYKGFTGWPDFSPDGEELVFTNDADKHTCFLVILNLKNKQIRRLTSPKLGAKRPTWHPEGHSIAYNVNNENIHIIQLSSMKSYLYISESFRAGRKIIHPCYAPDGKSILAASYQRGGPQREEVLYRVYPNNDQPIVEITDYPRVCAGRCTVHPNNEDVIFAGHAGSFNQLENRLWKVSQHQKAVPLELGDDSRCHGRCPSYSRDGRWVACVSARPKVKPDEETALGVWIIKSDGQESYKLTDGRFKPTHMTWSPDQKSLAVAGAFGVQLIRLPSLFHSN